MRNKTLTRSLLVLLVFVLLAGSCMTACKKENPDDPKDTPPVTDAETDAPEVDFYEDLRGYDFEDEKFKIYTYDDSAGWYLYFDEVEGSSQAVSASAFRRNEFVQDLLSVTLKIDKTEKYGDIVTRVQTLGGDADAPHLVVPYATTTLAALVSGNYLYNIQNLNHMHLDSEWYNQSANRNFTYKDKQYFFVSDLTYPVQQRFAYLANIDMIDANNALEKTETGASSIYELVKNGDWTLENLQAMTYNMYNNPNGGFDKTYDCTYGLATNLYAGSRTYNNWGVDLVSVGEDGTFEFNLYSEDLETLHTALVTYMHSQDVFFINPEDKYSSTNDYYNIFLAGRAMFSTFSSDPWLLKNDEYQEMHFAYLPYPKYQKADDYITVSHGGLMMVPSSIKDAEFVGVVIEALSRSSYENIRDSFITNYFEARVIQDPEGIEMYRIMRNSSYYDLARYLDPTKDNQGNLLCTNLLYLSYPLRESRTISDRYGMYGEAIKLAYTQLYDSMN